MTAILGTERSQGKKTFTSEGKIGASSQEGDDDSDNTNSRPINGVIFQEARLLSVVNAIEYLI